MIINIHFSFNWLIENRKVIFLNIACRALYFNVDVRIFTWNVKRILLWYVSEKKNLGYEDNSKDDSQVWPFKGEYAFVPHPLNSCELNSKGGSKKLFGSLCIPWLGDNLGLKCFRRISEQEGLPSDPAVVQPFTLSSLDWDEPGVGNLQHDSHRLLRHIDVSGQGLCVFTTPRADLVLPAVFYQWYCVGIWAIKKTCPFPDYNTTFLGKISSKRR